LSLSRCSSLSLSLCPSLSLSPCFEFESESQFESGSTLSTPGRFQRSTDGLFAYMSDISSSSSVFVSRPRLHLRLAALRLRCVCVAFALRLRCVCVAFALRLCVHDGGSLPLSSPGFTLDADLDDNPLILCSNHLSPSLEICMTRILLSCLNTSTH
jgi:hypothetical protein